MSNKQHNAPRTEKLGYLTDMEAEVMNIVWDAPEPMSTQDIHGVMLRNRESGGAQPIVLGTTLYTLDRLSQMGLVSDEKQGRSRYYTATQPREKVIARILSRTTSQLGGGPLAAIVQALSGMRKSKSSGSPGEAEQIERLLEEIRNLEAGGE